MCITNLLTYTWVALCVTMHIVCIMRCSADPEWDGEDCLGYIIRLSW